MPNDLTQYPHSMHDDPITGKPTQKTAARIIEASIQMPVEIQSRRTPPAIQTHNAVSVTATTGYSYSAWIDADGIDQVAITFANDAATVSYGDVHWSHDNGATTAGTDASVIASNNQRYKTGIVPTKARYFRLALGNTDAAAHTMNAWAYLKV